MSIGNHNKPQIPLRLKVRPLLYSTLGHLFPKPLAKDAYKLWFEPLSFEMPERELAVAKYSSYETMYVDGQKIRLWSWGKGPTVLFVHGWGGRGSQIYAYVASLVEAGFNVMGFDMPAHGQSDGFSTNVFFVSKVLKQIINRIDSLHTVITHSFGGMVLAYTYEKEMPIQRLVMLCPPARLETPVNHFKQLLMLSKKMKEYFKVFIMNDFGQDIYEKLSVEENVKKFDVPVLIIHDHNDSVVPFKDGESVAKSAKIATFIATDQLGHNKLLYDQEIIDKVNDFIKK